MSRNLVRLHRLLRSGLHSNYFRSLTTSKVASTNSVCYNVREVEIPTRDTYIAGKLWQGHDAAEGKQSNEYPIVCIHGWLDNANSFDPLLSKIMKPNRTVYALDLPGHGRSPLVNRYFDSFAEFLVCIRCVMQEFQWKKVVLFGHSMGSILSFSFSGIFPEYVAGYIGMDIVRSVPMDPVETVRSIVYGINKIDKKLAKKIDPPTYSYEEILERTYIGRQESVNLEGCKILLERGAVQLPNNKYRFSHDLRVTVPASVPASDETSRQIVKNIQCPVCIIKGDPGQYYEPKENFDDFINYMREHVKDFEFHYVPGTHHFHLNNPDLVVPIVSQFLDTKMIIKDE